MEKQNQAAPGHISNHMQIEYLHVDQFKPGLAHLRKPSRASARLLANNLQAFGIVLPLVIGPDNTLIHGHRLLEAAKILGWTELPVVRITHLTPDKLRVLAIALNRLGEIGKWDEKNLALELKDLSKLDLGFSLEITGFSMAEIDLKIEGLAIEEAEDEADALPAPTEGPAITQVGDLFQLGPHRLICGSASEPLSYQRLMAGERATQVNCDPPYNLPVDGFISGLGKKKHREFVEGTGEKLPEEFRTFLNTVIRLFSSNVADGGLIYASMDWRHVEDLLAAGRINELSLLNICVWVKPNAGLGSPYRSQHEFIVVFKKGTAPHQDNIQLGRFGRNRSNVWPYTAVLGFGREGDEGNLNLLHPTPKPVKMIADAILDSTKRGDIVLDPFLGSGTALIAAQRVGRRCYGMELDPLYADVIIRRWQNFTGERAIHVETGLSFDELAAIRTGVPA